MYKIGEFSKITNLTVKTLRYYDEQNILTPSFRNEENGYRFYNTADFKKAERIKLLRNLEFSISEMKDMLGRCETPSDLTYFLEEKKAMIENRILEEKFLPDKINFYRKPKQAEENGPDYEIEIRDIEPIAVASIKYKGKYSDIGKYMEKLYKAAGSHTEGCPFTLYYSAEYSDEADIECCLPVPAQLKQADAAVKQLSPVRAVCTKHKGGLIA